jgi:hypothetical protein
MFNVLKILAIIALPIFFVSCDPGFAVILSNGSASDKKITIKDPGGNRSFIWGDAFRDSISIVDTRKKRRELRFPTSVYYDSAHLGYSFILPPAHGVILYHGMGFAFIPPETIIVDGKDTVAHAIWKFKWAFMYSEMEAVIK